MSRMTRRQFLEESMFAAAAAAVAARAGKARAADADTGPKVGPNDRIRVACIGFRGQGQGHIRAYAGMDDVEIAMLCDADSSLFDGSVKIVEEKGKKAPKCVQDMRRVFDDKSIDAVSIATPNHWHALAAIWAMQAGKDVYVEKPVSHNVSEGRRIVQVARKYARICQTGTQCRSYAGTIEAIKYLHDGGIGKVNVARGFCYKGRDSIGVAGGDQPVPPTVDYDLWSGPAPKKPVHRLRFHYDWHWFWDYGNGDLGNQGIHQMDLARWGLNKATLPIAVVGLGGRFGYRDDGETPNTHVAFLDYGDSQLIFETRGLPTKSYKDVKVGAIFDGTDGYVVLSKYTGGAAFDLDGKKVKDFEGKGDHFRNFLKAVRSRKHTDLAADIEQGHLSSALCHLGNISYRLGTEQSFDEQVAAFRQNQAGEDAFARMCEHLKEQKVALDATRYVLGPKLAIDPKTESFPGNAKANALLTRNYRKPFVVPEKV